MFLYPRIKSDLTSIKINEGMSKNKHKQRGSCTFSETVRNIYFVNLLNLTNTKKLDPSRNLERKF